MLFKTGVCVIFLAAMPASKMLVIKKPASMETKKSVSTKSEKPVSTGIKEPMKSRKPVGKKSSQSDSEPFPEPESDVSPSAHPGWNGLEIPGRPEPLLPPGRHVRNIPFQDGMYQPAQTFLSGGGIGGDGITPMAFTVWLSCWTSQQLPAGMVV